MQGAARENPASGFPVGSFGVEAQVAHWRVPHVLTNVCALAVLPDQCALVTVGSRLPQMSVIYPAMLRRRVTKCSA